MKVSSYLGKVCSKVADDVTKSHNVDIAENILTIMTTVGFPIGDIEDTTGAYRKAQDIIKASAKRHGGLADNQEVYLKAIKLIGEATTPRERSILASAYYLCRSEYTLYAIKAAEDYIAGGLYLPSVDNVYKPGMTRDMLKREIIAGTYTQLGELYEKNYEFGKALKCYKEALQYDTWSHFPYIHMSEAYRKMNEPDKAIDVLKEAKEHPNYKKEPDLFYGDVVDKFLDEAKQRKARGYVFRKRGHKKFIPLDK